MKYSCAQQKQELEVFQQPVTREQIGAMCTRAFGRGTHILGLKELKGGQFNTNYLIQLSSGENVVLRVAPVPGQCRFWHERFLMRREQSIQPFLAPVASLLPRVIMTDFTHQIVERDYMFQSYHAGQSWSELSGGLTSAEHDDLWRQFGALVKTISSVEGTAFGLPYRGSQFPTWSLTIIDWLERTIIDAHNSWLDTQQLRSLLAIVIDHSTLLDEITQPQLLHGDLWWFNLLVERQEGWPRIVGVLDADRASWGDPLADWTFHLLPRRASAQEQALFWEAYGRPASTFSGFFREQVYEGLHQGKILSVAQRDDKPRVIARASEALEEVVQALRSICKIEI